MNVGIIGLPQTGKKTLFALLAGPDALSRHVDGRQPLRGVADVQDDRFDRLVDVYKPQAQVRARLEVVVLPKIEDNSISEGKIFKDMGDVDALCHVVRAFEDPSVYHAWGAPDPAREIESVYSELILHDQVFVEKRLERIERNLKKVKDERQLREFALMERFRDALEAERPLRDVELSRDEIVLIASYPFLTRRQLIVALNVADPRYLDETAGESVRGVADRLGLGLVVVAARVESEIAELDDPKERAEFMAELGLGETALSALSRQLIDALGVISFFTAAPNEVRQWFVRRGASAPEAAGTIHSDMERGFIRAEVMKYGDIVSLGGEEAVKAAGKFYLKGKDYVFEDGDVVKIRFNV